MTTDPDTDRTQVVVRLGRGLLRRVDAYARRLGVSRTGAIAFLVDRGLQLEGQTAIPVQPQGDTQ